MDNRPALPNKFGRHLQTTLDRAQIRVCSQRTELALGQRQFERADRSIRNMGEGTGGYPGFTYERIANELNRYAIALQYKDQLWEGFSPVTDEDRGAFQGDGEDWGDCLGLADL